MVKSGLTNMSYVRIHTNPYLFFSFFFFFFLIIEKNKVCEKGSVLISVRWKLSVIIFFLTERTARVMKIVITSQLFFELPRRTEQFRQISRLKSQKKQKVERKLLLEKVKL